MTCQHLFQLHWPSIRIHLHWPELSHKIDFACDGLDECFSLNLPTCALTHARQPPNNIKTASSVNDDSSEIVIIRSTFQDHSDRPKLPCHMWISDRAFVYLSSALHYIF